MSLKFLADHCVPNAIIESLRQDGHDVHRLAEYLPTDSADSVVIDTAKEQKAILLSLNGDFADIVAYPPSKYSGIICIQLKNHPSLIPDLLGRLRTYISTHPQQTDYVGKLLVIEVHRIRIRT